MYTCIHIHKYNIYRKIYTKLYQNVVYILCRFCIHFVYVNSDHKNYVYNLYTKFIQNAYNSMYSKCIPHLNTFFMLFLANHCTHFKLETCWLNK